MPPPISIVVPNYNGGKTIGATLQSLIDQAYPNLQIIVVDGASTDQSVRVIKGYQPHIDWWVSEPDGGQTQAINKGLARCTGRVVNWLCSDDTLKPNALHTVGEHFDQSPDIDVVCGVSEVTYSDGGPTKDWLFTPTPDRIALIPCCNPIAQPSCFYRRSLLRQPNALDETFQWAMDFELWAYFVSKGARFKCIDDHLSVYPNDGTNKTSIGGAHFIRDHVRIYRKYVTEPVPLIFWHRSLRNPLQRFLMHHPRHRMAWRAVHMLKRVDAMLGRFYDPARVRAMDWRPWTSPTPN